MSKITLEILEKVQKLDLSSLKLGQDEQGYFISCEDEAVLNDLSKIANEAFGSDNEDQNLSDLINGITELAGRNTELEIPEHAKTEKMKGENEE